MKPAAFDYYAPGSVDEAVELLARHGDDAKILAGGQSLVPMMNLRLAQPRLLIDINRLAELDYVRHDGSCVAIGALTRHHDVATHASVASAQPLLSAAAALIGYPAIRYRGTIGGSVAHADPVSEMPCAALTLDADLVVVSTRGRRTIPASDFFLGYFATALAADELLVELRFDASRPRTGWAFQEFARKSGDFAVLAVAVDFGIEAGVIRACRIGMAGVTDRPLRAGEAEAAMRDRRPGTDAITAGREAVQAMVTAAVPARDAAYKPHLAGALAERALTTALGRAERRS